MNFLADNTALFGLILSMATPLVTAVAQRPGWTSQKRSLVGAGTSLVIGFLTVAAAGQLGDASTLLTTLGVVVVGAEAAYQKLWQPSGVAGAIEYKTTPTSQLG